MVSWGCVLMRRVGRTTLAKNYLLKGMPLFTYQMFRAVDSGTLRPDRSLNSPSHYIPKELAR